MIHSDECLECFPTTFQLSLEHNASLIMEYVDCTCTCTLLSQMELKLRSGSCSIKNNNK
jgi:hypothetical protein